MKKTPEQQHYDWTMGKLAEAQSRIRGLYRSKLRGTWPPKLRKGQDPILPLAQVRLVEAMCDLAAAVRWSRGQVPKKASAHDKVEMMKVVGIVVEVAEVRADFATASTPGTLRKPKGLMKPAKAGQGQAKTRRR